MDRNEELCLNLMIPLTITEAKARRVEMSYYQKILADKTHDSLHDMKVRHGAQDLSLSEFYNKILLAPFAQTGSTEFHKDLNLLGSEVKLIGQENFDSQKSPRITKNA